MMAIEVPDLNAHRPSSAEATSPDDDAAWSAIGQKLWAHRRFPARPMTTELGARAAYHRRTRSPASIVLDAVEPRADPAACTSRGLPTGAWASPSSQT